MKYGSGEEWAVYKGKKYRFGFYGYGTVKLFDENDTSKENALFSVDKNSIDDFIYKLYCYGIMNGVLYSITEIENEIVSYEEYSGEEKVIRKRIIEDFDMIFSRQGCKNHRECKIIFIDENKINRNDVLYNFWADDGKYGLLEFSVIEDIISIDELYEELLDIYGNRIGRPFYKPFDWYKTDLRIDDIRFEIWNDWGLVNIAAATQKGNDYIREISAHFRNSRKFIQKYKDYFPNTIVVS